jgi:hypothetical protein
VKIKSAQNENDNFSDNELKQSLFSHQFEANIFYELQNYYKKLAKSDSSIFVLSMDYEKIFLFQLQKLVLSIIIVSFQYIILVFMTWEKKRQQCLCILKIFQ